MPWYKNEEELLANMDSEQEQRGYTMDDLYAARRWDPANDSGLIGDVGRGLARGAIGLADAAVGLADVGYNAATGESLRAKAQEMGWTPDEWTAYLNSRDSFATQDARAAYDRADGFVDSIGAIITNPRLLASMGAEQIPQLVPMLGVAGKAGKVAKALGASEKGIRRAAIAGASATEGALTTGSVGAAIGDEYVQNGTTDDRRLAGAALGAGVSTAAIGLGMAPFGGAVEAAVGARFANTMGKTALRRAGKSALGEGVEETLQSGQEQMWQNYATDQDLMEGVGKAAGTGFVLGGAMGGALHPFTGESAKSQRNLIAGANPTSEERRKAISIADEEQAQAIQQQEAIANQQQQVLEQQAMAAQQQAAAAQQAVPMEQAPQEPVQAEEKPTYNIGKLISKDIGFNFEGMAKTLQNKITDPQGNKLNYYDAFNALSDTQKSYVVAAVGAHRAVGDLDSKSFKKIIENAMLNAYTIESDDMAEVDAVIQSLSDRTPQELDFKHAMNEIIGQNPQDPTLKDLPISERIKIVADTPMPSKVAEQQAVPVEAPKAKATPVEAPTNDVDAETDNALTALENTGIPKKETPQVKRRRKAESQFNQEVEDEIAAMRAHIADKDKEKNGGMAVAFSRSTRTAKDSLLDEVKPRKYTKAEAKDFEDGKRAYQRIERHETGIVDDVKKISKDDSMAGTDARRIVLDFMENRSDLDMKTALTQMYGGLTARSLRFLHKDVMDKLDRRYVKHGKATPLPQRWLANVLDEMITAKEKDEKFEVPKYEDMYDVKSMPKEVASIYDNSKRLTDFGLASDFMDAPGDTTVETFELSDEDVKLPRQLTVQALRDFNLTNKAALDTKRRFDNTVRDIMAGKARLLVSADDDSNFGMEDDAGTARSLLRVVQTTTGRKAPKTEGWKVIEHADGTPATKEEEVAIATKAMLRMLERNKKPTPKSETAKADYLEEAFPVSATESAKAATAKKTESGDNVAGMRVDNRRNYVPLESLPDLVKAQEKLADHAGSANTPATKLFGDMKNILPLLFKERLVKSGIKFGKGHPFLKFLRADHKKIAAEDVGTAVEGAEYMLAGFYSASMVEPLAKSDKTTAEDFDQLFKSTSSAESTAVSEAWKATARDIGRMIDSLNRPTAQKKYIADRLVEFVDAQFAITTTPEGSDGTAKGDALNRYQTEVNELKESVVKQFARSLNSSRHGKQRVPFTWVDKKSKAAKAFSSMGGTGMVSTKSKEGLDLRKQFKDEVVEPRFKAEFGKPLSKITEVPLTDRMDFYDAVANDNDLVLTWKASESEAAARTNPNGTYAFKPMDEAEGTTQIDDFSTKDLWMPEWVKASGLFTSDELANSTRMSQGKKSPPNGSAELGFLMEGASKDYARRIKYDTEFGIAQEHTAAIDKAEMLRNEGKRKEHEGLKKAEDNLRNFFIESGSTEKRLNNHWSEIASTADKYVKSLAKVSLVDQNSDAYKVALKEFQANKKALPSVGLKLLTRNTWGEKRAELKQKLNAYLADYMAQYRLLNQDVAIAQVRKELADREEFKRMAENDLIKDANTDSTETRKYIAEQMSNMSLWDVTQIAADGKPLDRSAVEAARAIVRTIVSRNSFLQVSEKAHKEAEAMDVLAKAVDSIMNTQGVVQNPKLFADALAAYLREAYAGFGEALNNYAYELFKRHRAQLVKKGFVPSNNETAYHDAVKAKEAAVEAYKADPTEENFDAVRDAITARELAFGDALDREASKRFEKEVFTNAQMLHGDTVAEVHKAASRLAKLGADQSFQNASDYKKTKLATTARKMLQDVYFLKFDGDSSIEEQAIQIKEAYQNEESYTTRGLFSKRSQAPKELVAAVKSFKDTVSEAIGSSRSDMLTSMVQWGVLNGSELTNNLAGMYLELDGRGPCVFLNPKNREATFTVAHELSHRVFAVDKPDAVHKFLNMKVDVNTTNDVAVTPVGYLAQEIFALKDTIPSFGSRITEYPLNEKKFDADRMQGELLAQAAATWLTDANFRAKAEEVAPRLSIMFKDFFIGDSNGNGPQGKLRTPLGKLGKQNSSGTLPSGDGVLSRREGTDTRGYTQNGNTGANGRGSASLSGEHGGSIYDSDVRSETDKVTSRIPAKYKPLAEKAMNVARGLFGDYGVNTILGGLFTSDLAKVVRGVMPSIDKWVALSKQRDAWINARQHELSEFRHRFEALDKNVLAKVDDILARMTLEGVWANKEDWMEENVWNKDDVDEELKATYGKIQDDYKALPPEARQIVDDVLEYGQKSQALRQQLLTEKTEKFKQMLAEQSENADEYKELVSSLDATLEMARNYTKSFKAPYVPLLREGSHVVVARSSKLEELQNQREDLRKKRRNKDFTDEDAAELQKITSQITELKQSDKDYVVMFVDGQAKANLMKAELEKDFNGTVEAFPREQIGRHQTISLATINELERQLVRNMDAEDSDEARKLIKKMVTMLNEMYTMNLADYHANKNRLRRQKVAGFDKNMTNSFLVNGYRESLFYGNVKFQDDMANSLRDMRDESNKTGDGVTREDRKRVLNEVMKREELNYSYTPSEGVARAQRVTSVMMLLTSPAFYLQNLTQSFMMTAPYLTKDYAAGKVYENLFDNTRKMIEAYFNKANRNGIEVDFDKLPWMSSEVKQGLEDARSRGLIDIGIAQDFGELIKHNKFQAVTDYLSRGARIVEMVNRVSSFKTAFDLKYKDAVANGEKDPIRVATDYACEAILETHGDYSATNEPRFFRRGGLGLGVEKLIFQFRKFQLIQLGFVARMTNDAFAGASPEMKMAARRALGWTMGVHFAMTGLKGTPLVATVAWLLNAMFGDEDDTEEDTLRKFIGDKPTADLLIRVK